MRGSATWLLFFTWTLTPCKRGGLEGSTQHWLEVHSQEFENLRFFSGVGFKRSAILSSSDRLFVLYVCVQGGIVLARTWSQRPQEIKKLLLLLWSELIKKRDHIVGFGAVASVLLNGIDEAAIRGTGAAIMQKEDALP